jgi:hypothetical protein
MSEAFGDIMPEDREEIIRQADHQLQQAYKAIFAGNAAAREIVLQDLRNFCLGDRSCIVRGPAGIDLHATIAASGRREVWLRLCKALELDSHTGL